MPLRFFSYSRLLNHPWRILAIVLAVVFVVETALMLALPLIVSDDVDERVSAIVDSTLLTLICAPVLWWIIIGPLRRIAIIEQARSETITSNAGDGIMTVDQGGTILSYNRAANRLFQYDVAEIIGQPIQKLIPNVCLAATAPDAPLESNGLRRDQKTFPASLSINSLPSEIEDAFVVIVRDLTGSQRAEQLRVDAAREKEALRTQQMATQAQLATGVAHEIRNPLTSIKMLLQANAAYFQENGLPSKDLQLVESEIRRIERSVNALLDFARPSPPERRRVDLVASIRRTMDLLAGRANNQEITMEIAGRSTVTVVADAEQLHQLFLNLSLNAFDAMPEGGTLKFDVHQHDQHAVVTVTDTGHGIDDDLIDEIFKPFVTTKKTGVGLGLGICRRIAEDQGGQLTGENVSASGARFTLRLPVVAPDQARKPE